jgi:hypothetical protein
VFVEEVLHAVTANATRLTALTAQLDSETKALANRPAVSAKSGSVSPGTLGVEFRLAPLASPVEILVGDVEKQFTDGAEREMLKMLATAVPVSMKDYGVFEITRGVAMPRGWIVPRPHVESGRYAAAIQRIRWHGLEVQRVATETRVDVERFVVQSFTKSERQFQGHHEARMTGTHERAQLLVDEGSLFIPAAQPLARLAFYLLEAESDDGFVTWNLIENGLGPGATYPIYRVMNMTGLRLTN